MHGSESAATNSICTCSPTSRSSNLIALRKTTFSSRCRNCITCLRLNMSNWRINVAARAAALLISWSDLLPSSAIRRADLQQAGVTLNHSKNVVKIVSDPRGQLSDCFHFLRLPKLPFKQGPLRDVFRLE